MKIIDIPEYHDRKDVVAMSPDTPVEDAARLIKAHNYGATVVTENEEVVGIFTERDILNKIVAEGLDYKTLRLKDVMTRKVKVARESDDITNSLRRMSQGRFRHLPVVDDHNKLIGMMSQGDFVAITWPQLIDRFKSHSRREFLTHTQLWMMLLVVLAYFTFAPLIIGFFQ